MIKGERNRVPTHKIAQGRASTGKFISGCTPRRAIVASCVGEMIATESGAYVTQSDNPIVGKMKCCAEPSMWINRW